jgi:hypothetical protein
MVGQARNRPEKTGRRLKEALIATNDQLVAMLSIREFMQGIEGHQFAHCRINDAAIGAAEAYGEVGPDEFADDLPAGAAGTYWICGVRTGYGERGKALLALGESGNQSRSFCADGHSE